MLAEINIRFLSVCVNSPTRLWIDAFQSSRYFRKTFSNQSSLGSSALRNGSQNGLRFHVASDVLREFRQSKNLPICSQNSAVPLASVPHSLRFFDTDSLNACAANLTVILEYGFSLMWSTVRRGQVFPPLCKSV